MLQFKKKDTKKLCRVYLSIAKSQTSFHAIQEYDKVAIYRRCDTTSFLLPVYSHCTKVLKKNMYSVALKHKD